MMVSRAVDSQPLLKEEFLKVEKVRDELGVALKAKDDHHAAEIAKLKLHYEQQLYLINLK